MIMVAACYEPLRMALLYKHGEAVGGVGGVGGLTNQWNPLEEDGQSLNPGRSKTPDDPC